MVTGPKHRAVEKLLSTDLEISFWDRRTRTSRRFLRDSASMICMSSAGVAVIDKRSINGSCYHSNLGEAHLDCGNWARTALVNGWDKNSGRPPAEVRR